MDSTVVVAGKLHSRECKGTKTISSFNVVKSYFCLMQACVDVRKATDRALARHNPGQTRVYGRIGGRPGSPGNPSGPADNPDPNLGPRSGATPSCRDRH